MENIMCFSAKVEQDLKKLEVHFNATVNSESFANYQFLKGYEQSQGPEAIKHKLGLTRKSSTSKFQWVDNESSRIYPNYFAPVIIWLNGKRQIVPMRYRVRPHGMPKEIPSKYNVFNARLDSLNTRKTWTSLFGAKHALFPFRQFYEWVDYKGRKKLITFIPEGRDIMWAPALYDSWASHDGTIEFSSFAIITDDPPAEVSEQGHDRCPIFLREDLIDTWLRPTVSTKVELMKILKQKETVYYEHSYEVAA